jgi:hypothetical protein
MEYVRNFFILSFPPKIKYPITLNHPKTQSPSRSHIAAQLAFPHALSCVLGLSSHTLLKVFRLYPFFGIE